MPNTDDQAGWLQLLSSLTDDELHRYGEIAADQRRLEWQYAWAQGLLALGAIAALGWFGAECLTRGLTGRGFSVLGLGLALGYWPYRRAVVRRIWGRHLKAVSDEETARNLKHARK